MDSILAIDPGLTTGFAFRSHDGNFFTWQHVLDKDGNLPYTYFMQQLEELTVDIVVCERFDFRQNKTGIDYTPVELIGIIKSWNETEVGLPIVWQGQDVKSKKGFWTDEKLKAYGLYKPNMPHAMDAAKHLMHYLAKINDLDLTVLRPLANVGDDS